MIATCRECGLRVPDYPTRPIICPRCGCQSATAHTGRLGPRIEHITEVERENAEAVKEFIDRICKEINLITNVRPDLENTPWDDLDKGSLGHGTVERIGGLPRGMASGRTSVAILIRTDDDKLVVGEMSLAHFQMASAAFKGRYGSEE